MINRIINKYYNFNIDFDNQDYTNQFHLKFVSYITTKNQFISDLGK